MISVDPIAPANTVVALFETDEQSALRTADLICECLAADNIAVSLSDAGGELWRVAIHFRSAPDEGAVRTTLAAGVGFEAAKALRFEAVAKKDWVRASMAGLKPVVAGRFVVHGAHDRGRIPLNGLGIEIEASLAFGTGHHGTTRGCLLALDRICKSLSTSHVRRRRPEVLARSASLEGYERGARAVALRGSLRLRLRATRPRAAVRVLDLGTGSGVLAIAAALALRQRVLATDIDAKAVAVARANSRLNRVGTMVEIVKADGVGAHGLRERAPFDLVFANILLGPLQRIAAPLGKLTRPGGRVVLSGLLAAQANAALAAYRGFALERRIELEGWTTLVLARRGGRLGVARRQPTP